MRSVWFSVFIRISRRSMIIQRLLISVYTINVSPGFHDRRKQQPKTRQKRENKNIPDWVAIPFYIPAHGIAISKEYDILIDEDFIRY